MGLPIIYVRGFAGDTLEWRASEDSPGTPVPLLTLFLASTQRAVDETGTTTLPTVRHALRFRLISLREQGGVFHSSAPSNRRPDWDDTLVVDIEPGDGQSIPGAWATWNSEIPGPIHDWAPSLQEPRLGDADDAKGVWEACIPVPRSARPILGDKAEIALTVSARR